MWQSKWRYWEDGLSFTNDQAEVLTAVEADPLNGYWSFTEPQTAVYANGFVHDPYAAAAEILTVQAAKVPAGQIRKWSADGTSIEYEQSSKDVYLELAAEYKSRSPRFGQVKSVEMVRGDQNAF